MKLLENDGIYPIVKELDLDRKFRFFWMKYVTDINLDKHCAAGLKGPYDKRISLYKNRGQTHWEDITLDQGESDLYYICGVAQPFNGKKISIVY